MSMSPDATDLLPPKIGLAAAATPDPAYRSLLHRDQLPGGFFGRRVGEPRRLLTRRGVLALAAYRVLAAQGINLGELPPDAFLRWADLWLHTRGTDKPVRELVVRFYGRPGEPDSKVSLLPNEDLLNKPPATGALLTIRLDLDAVFTRTERALAAAEAPEVWEGPDVD